MILCPHYSPRNLVVGKASRKLQRKRPERFRDVEHATPKFRGEAHGQISKRLTIL
jgi:hypothetical protein